MLVPEIQDVLNKQIAMEADASFSYLAMASWCETQSLEGCAEFLYRQSEEERTHMMKLVKYVNETDGVVTFSAIKEPKGSYESIQELFETVYAQEKGVTAAINDIVALSYKVKDHATLNFIQWYVEEQREEEALMRTILDRIKLIGNGPQSLYYIDKEVSAINTEQEKLEAEEDQ